MGTSQVPFVRLRGHVFVYFGVQIEGRFRCSEGISDDDADRLRRMLVEPFIETLKDVVELNGTIEKWHIICPAMLC